MKSEKVEEEKKYEIEKDIILKCWVVWEVHKNYKVDVFKAKLKRDCKEWLDKKVKQ